MSLSQILSLITTTQEPSSRGALSELLAMTSWTSGSPTESNQAALMDAWLSQMQITQVFQLAWKTLDWQTPFKTIAMKHPLQIS